MTTNEFCRLHPRLYHMATADALPQIEKYGLMSSQTICDLVGATPQQREALLAQRRPELVTLTHPKHGMFTLRDQKPMTDSKLEGCLDGITLPDWYRLLNSRVFMWANKARVETLLNARAYRKRDQLVLTIDSHSLLEAHAENTTLSSINSGATFYVPVRRGRFTFTPLKEYPVGRNARSIVEITLTPAIPDMAKFIVDAEVRRGA